MLERPAQDCYTLECHSSSISFFVADAAADHIPEADVPRFFNEPA